MVDPITMGIIGWVCGKLADSVLKYLAGNRELSQEVDKALAEWAKTLRADRYVEPKALFADVDAARAEDERPQYCALQAKLVKKELPTKGMWHAAFMEGWRWVRDHIEGPQPFFLLEESEASTELERLAEVMYTTCAQYKPIFNAAVIEKLDSIGSRIDELVTQAPADVQAIFEEATDLINSGEAKAAQVVLEHLWKRCNERMAPQEKSNCKRLMGCSFDRQDRPEEAGRSFLEAKDYDPTWEKARAFESLGYLLFGNPTKAYQLAEGVLADFSQNTMAWAVWIRTSPDSTSLAEIEKRVPDHLKTDAEVAMALATRALANGCYEVAEKYAALAEKQVPGNPRVLERLGELMLARARINEHLLRQRRPTNEEMNYLQKARDFFTEALRKWRKENSQSGIVRVLLRLAWVRNSLGEHSRAKDDIRAAHEADESSPDTIFWYALTLSEDDLGGAIELLRSVVGTGPTPDVEFLLGQMLRERHNEGDVTDALKLLKTRLSDLGRAPADFRVNYLSLLLELQRQAQNINDARSTLGAIGEDLIGNTTRAILWAEVLWKNGDTVDAMTAARVALGSVNQETSVEDQRKLADLLQTMGLHREALSLWKAIVGPEYIGKDTYSLIQCAQRCEDIECILEFSENLRANGLWDRRIFELELSCREKYNDTKGAIKALEHFLESPADKTYIPYARLYLSVHGIREGKPELIETDPTKLPSVTAVEPYIGQHVVDVLRRGPDPLVAVNYAYELVRLNWDDPCAHMAMVKSLLPDGPPVDTHEPDCVTEGTAVAYRENDTGLKRWHIIENSAIGTPESTRKEFPPGNYISQAMIGKRAGETFYLERDVVQERTATIEDVMSKYKYRFNVCFEELNTTFSQPRTVRKIIVTNVKGEYDFSVLERLAQERAESARKIEELYKNNPCPLYVLANLRSASMVQTMHSIIAGTDVPLRCCLGSDDEQAEAIKSLVAAKTIVLDSTAIVTLLFTDVYRQIEKFPIAFATTEGVLNDLRRTEVLHLDPNSEGGTFSVDGFVPTSQTDLRKTQDAIYDIIDFIERRCRVESGLAVATFEKERREQLLQLFGHAGLESIMLAAQADHVLWTDDLPTALFARAEFGCRRIWTQIVFQHFAEQGILPKDLSMDVALKLFRMRYYYVRPSVPIIVRAVEEADGRVDSPPLCQVLTWFSDQNADKQGQFMIAAGVMKCIWQSRLIENAVQQVTIRILEHLSRRQGGMEIIQGLFQNIDRIFGVDVMNAHKTRQIIAGWLRGGGPRIILP
jgi:tetratricopeptide (TPR) repeat protein